MKAAARLRLNPQLLAHVEQSRCRKTSLSLVGGWRFYTDFYEILRSDRVRATPLNISRLERVADAIGFPRTAIFIGESK